MKAQQSIRTGGISRRLFVKRGLQAGALTVLTPRLLRAAAGANGRVNVACCGIGARGAEDVKALHATGLVNIVALCDTDMGAKPTLGVLKQFPNVPRFQDFRQMLDKMGKDIDAVCIGTPDFSHFPIAMRAMALGKHVYSEKPMGHSFRQIELMMAAEKKYGVATQMGNQGHSEGNYYQFKAWTEAGIIKNVTKITAFMNGWRRWHGMQVSGLLAEESIPATLDWETWLATEEEHKYNKGYTNGDWRSWYDFGNGALGDWGAHIFDTAHEFLHLGLPESVTPELQGWNRWIFPQASTLKFAFPARGAMPPCELTWYDGQKNLPPLPPDFGEAVRDANIPPPSKGSLDANVLPPGKVIYGEGLTFKGGSHGAMLKIIPEAKAKELAATLPEVPKVPSKPSAHHKNFLLACQGAEKCHSPFSVAGPLCQTMALGVLAQRVNARLEFDREAKRITNHEVANGLLQGATPRPEWEEYYRL